MKLVRMSKTYGKVRIGKYLSENFPIQNGLKQRNALSPLLFNFPLECVIRKAQENQVRLKLNGTNQLLVYADNVNLLRYNIDTISENTEILTDASKEVGLEINIEKTKYMFLSRHRDGGENQDIKISNRLFGNVSQFRYLGMTVTNQKLIKEKIKKRLNSGYNC
jgi:hypothetical protein